MMVKALIKDWAAKVGHNEALARLIRRRIGTSTAERLVKGTHEHELRGPNLTIVLEEMAKDGFVLADDAS